ncbi:MAG: hypothetical protein KDI63_17020 [Gammaproteobacteria bacterium]|nr:hypothetical protein [Gammaproteobacteria bacterium]
MAATAAGEYTYDDMNRLMAVDDTGLQAVYEYHSEVQLIAEVDDAGATGKEYAYLEGQLLSMLIPGQSRNVDRFVLTGGDYGSNLATAGDLGQ